MEERNDGQVTFSLLAESEVRSALGCCQCSFLLAGKAGSVQRSSPRSATLWSRVSLRPRGQSLRPGPPSVSLCTNEERVFPKE